MARDGVCAVPGCGRQVYARGWCPAHYTRWRDHGDILAAIPLRTLVPSCVSCGNVLPPRPVGTVGRPPRTCSPSCRDAAKRRRARGVANPYSGRRYIQVGDDEGPRLCSVEGCGRRAYTRGWCRAHYKRWRLDGDVLPDMPVGTRRRSWPPQLCSVRGCNKRLKSRALCATHYRRWLRTGSTRTSNYSALDCDVRPQCKVGGCDRDAMGRQPWCRAHYRQWLRTGTVGDGPLQPRARRGSGRLPCIVPGCGRSRSARALCVVHYQAWRVHETAEPWPCLTPGCVIKVYRLDWCHRHDRSHWGSQIGVEEKRLDQLSRLQAYASVLARAFVVLGSAPGREGGAASA